VSLRATFAGLKSFVWSAPPADAEVGGLSARYAYAVWMRHLVLASQYGLIDRPNVVAELGPGNTLGVGIAALLSGANRYYALDVVPYTSPQDSVAMLFDLVKLFEDRASIPDCTEFPEIKPRLDSHAFPHDILTAPTLARSLRPERVAAISAALRKPDSDVKCDGEEVRIQYSAPWNDSRIIDRNSVDFLVSQAAMEYVEDLPPAYRAMMDWLRPGGIMTHQIDFRCHYTANRWNGHWAYSDWHWRVIKGKRPYLLNREPLSGQLRYAAQAGFDVLGTICQVDKTGIDRSALAHRFRRLTDQDLVTSGTFVAYKKPTK
jgi:hypothetical protein